MENPFEILDQKLDLILKLLQAQSAKTKSPVQEWGNVDFASEITGYAPQTIYTKTGRGEMPHTKRDGKLWFNRNELLSWIEKGTLETIANGGFSKKPE